jgi:hypothetical protein
MRSGDPSTMDYNYFSVRLEFDSIDDKKFRQIVLHSLPDLVNKKDGSWKPYTEGEYDEEKFEIVDGMWDHEHCDICNFSIGEDYTYWVNSDSNILCDECHDHFVQYNRDRQATR